MSSAAAPTDLLGYYAELLTDAERAKLQSLRDLLDDVAARHPDLQVIMAHPSVPWQDEALSIATHKGNAWIDLSGWSAKYFSPALVRAARTYLNAKMLFGSDLPALTPDRWLTDFATLEFPEAAVQAIVKDNAVRLLGLG